MSTTAKVIEHSISPAGIDLMTMQLRYPRFVHSEFMTHRVFSRNASSSRAIPVAKMIEQVRNEPAMPIHWGKNQPGMQAREELNESVRCPSPVARRAAIEGDLPILDFNYHLKLTREEAWRRAANQAADIAQAFEVAGYHKQVVNRILEPFQFINVVVTASEWQNFYDLRDHEDADPNIAHLARVMKVARDASTPVYRPMVRGSADAWHLPYITLEEREQYRDQPRTLAKASGARCARTSYLTHEFAVPTLAKDLELYDKLVGSVPLHASPVEHQAYPLPSASTFDKNFRGWRQQRTLVEAEMAGRY